MVFQEVAYHEDTIVRIGKLYEFFGLFDAQDERLLDVDILARQ
jgi:hypothetical protein